MLEMMLNDKLSEADGDPVSASQAGTGQPWPPAMRSGWYMVHNYGSNTRPGQQLPSVKTASNWFLGFHNPKMVFSFFNWKLKIISMCRCKREQKLEVETEILIWVSDRCITRSRKAPKAIKCHVLAILNWSIQTMYYRHWPCWTMSEIMSDTGV